MFDISKIFRQKPYSLSKEEMAQMLGTNPEALAAFEKMYASEILPQDAPEDFFEVNSRQMAEHMQSAGKKDSQAEELIKRIVKEFLAETKIWRYIRPKENGEHEITVTAPQDIIIANPVSKDEIMALPEDKRPQCTSHLQKRDIGQMSYPMLLYNWKEAQNPARSQKDRLHFYHMFRQGLDILDIDPVVYEMIGTNVVSIGYWLPRITDAIDNQRFFKIPSTTIIKVPMNMLQLTRTEYQTLTRTTLDIVDRFCYEAFGLKEDGDYFIKTGTYSSKFDFRNCRVHAPKEIRELGEYLLFIHYQACQMASPLSIGEDGRPRSVYGVSTTNEWCVREYIPDSENNPCIYKGLPLHTEYRVFVDFDLKKVLSCVPYWNPKVMKERFEKNSDTSIHDKHDYVTFAAHEETLMKRYNENRDTVVEKLQALLPDIKMTGQWSIDIMQNGKDFWIIDMATAQTSAFKESIPEEFRRPLVENWLPGLEKTCIKKK